MHRSKWKFPFILVDYLQGPASIGIEETLRNVNRSVSIPNHFYKKRAAAYNGRTWIFFSIKNSMLGRKFGEFSISKILGSHTLRKKKKKKKK